MVELNAGVQEDVSYICVRTVSWKPPGCQIVVHEMDFPIPPSLMIDSYTRKEIWQIFMDLKLTTLIATDTIHVCQQLSIIGKQQLAMVVHKISVLFTSASNRNCFGRFR